MGLRRSQPSPRHPCERHSAPSPDSSPCRGSFAWHDRCPMSRVAIPNPGKWGGRQVRLPPSAVIVAGPVGHWGDNRKHSHVVSFPQLDPKQTSGEIFPALPNLHRTGPRSESTSPTPRPPIPRSCAAWPTAPPRRAHCPLPWTQSRIAATDKVDQAIRIWSLRRCGA